MKILLKSGLFLILIGHLHADYFMPTFNSMVKRTDCIADITVVKFNDRGQAVIKVNENIVGKAPELITGVWLSCVDPTPEQSGTLKAGKRYLVFLIKGNLFEGSTAFPIREISQCVTVKTNGESIRKRILKRQCYFYKDRVRYHKSSWQEMSLVKEIIKKELNKKSEKEVK